MLLLLCILLSSLSSAITVIEGWIKILRNFCTLRNFKLLRTANNFLKNTVKLGVHYLSSSSEVKRGFGSDKVQSGSDKV